MLNQDNEFSTVQHELLSQLQQLKQENAALKKQLKLQAAANKTFCEASPIALLQAQANDIARVGGWEFDFDTKKATWTKVTREIHEVADDFIPSLEKGIQFYKEGISRDTISAVVNAALLHAEAFDVELEIISAKGNLRWVRAKGKPVFIEGKAVKITGIFQDITTEKRLADEYREMQEKFKSAFYHSALGMAIVNTDGSWAEINDSLCNIVGYDKAELLSGGFQLITHPEDIDASIGFLNALQYGNKAVIKAEKRYIHKNGAIVWISIVVSVVKNKHGIITQFFTHLEDISYRKQMQQALQRSEQEYKSLFEQNPFGVFSLCRDGYFTSVNEVMVSKTGYAKENILQLHYSALVQPSYIERAREKLAIAFNGQPQKDEILLISPDGSKVFFSLIILPIVVNNVITGVYGIANDITANKKVERALMDSENNIRTILESAGVGYILLDKQLNIVSFNQYAAAYSLAERNNILKPQTSFLSYFPQEDHTEISSLLNETFAGKKIEYDRESVLTENVKHWHHIRYIPIVNNREQINGIVVAIEDVTHQKNAAEAIKNERNQLRTLIDNIPDAVYIKDLEAKKIITNEIDMKLMGVAAEADVIGKTDLEIFPDEKGLTGYQDDIRLLTTGLPIVNKEQMFYGEDGRQQWLLTTKVPIRNNQGIITGLLGIGRDITQQRQNQAAIKKSNERFELVTKATFDAIWDWDIITGQVYYGEGFETIFGYPSGDLLTGTAHWENLLHPEDRERLMNRLGATIKGNDTEWQDEYRFLKADGNYAYVIDKSVIVKDDAGKSIRMIGAMQDITERKKEEKQLKLFESVIKNITDAVLITEAEPVEGDGPAILFINDAFTNSTGYTLADVIGKTPRILQGPKTNRKELDKLKAALKKWQPVEVELLNYKKNGEEFWVNISITPLANETGYFTHWISIQKDITIKKRAAEETDFFYSLLAIINTNDTFESILNNAIKKIADWLHFDAAEVWTYNFVKSKIIFRALYEKAPAGNDWHDSNRIAGFEKGQGLPGAAVEQKQIVCWENLSDSPFLRDEGFAKAGLESGMAVPIFFDGEVIAVLCFYSKKTFTQHQLTANILTKISNELGAGIQKNRVEAELNSFFELSPDMLCILGTDGYFKKVNPAFTAILGYTEQELLAIPKADFVHPEDWVKTTAELQRLLNGGEPFYFENRYVTRRADIKYLAWSFTVVADEGLVFAVAKDITYSKRLEQEKTNILESISDYFYALDTSFNFTYINSATQQLFNMPGSSLLGENIWDTFPALKDGPFYNYATQALAAQQPVHFEFFDEPANTWFEESLYPTEDGLAVFFRSVNSRKESEAKLNDLNAVLAKNTADLQASNAELERFAYVASHDLQEPLRMVSGFMQLLQKKYHSVLDENGKKYVDFAIDGAARMKALMNDLLHYSRSGAGSIEKEPVDMNEITADVQMTLKATINETGTTLIIDKLPVVNASYVMVTQLMQNLIGNAIKYQPKDKKPLIAINSSRQEDVWVFSVEDNGIGITPGYEEKIFEVFQRLHTRQSYSGSGIGLAICKKIADKLGGKIWVESNTGGGSIFKFTIPV